MTDKLKEKKRIIARKFEWAKTLDRAYVEFQNGINNMRLWIKDNHEKAMKIRSFRDKMFDLKFEIDDFIVQCCAEEME